MYTKKNSPWLSVIMSAYNAESSIKEAMQSILNQSYAHFEFIIIDDGSTDNTYSIISSFQDKRIICLKNEENIGLTRSLNKGILHSKYDFIVRMDADDISDDQRFEILIKELSNFPEAGVICSRAWIFHEDTNDSYLSMKLDSPEEIYVHLQFRNCLMHSSVLMRRDVLDKYGMYNESFRYAQDYELWNRLSKSVVIHQIQKSLVTWHAPREENATNKNEKWAVAEHRVFCLSCAYFFKPYNQIIPKYWIEKIKYIIGPNPPGCKKISFFGLFIIRLIFKLLLHRIIEKSPNSLNKEKVKEYSKQWNENFQISWRKEMIKH